MGEAVCPIKRGVYLPFPLFFRGLGVGEKSGVFFGGDGVMLGFE